MSATAAKPVYRDVRRPGPWVKVLAVLVVIALAGLAAYAVYAPPTRVKLASPSAAQHQRTAPATPTAEPEREGGEGGD